MEPGVAADSIRGVSTLLSAGGSFMEGRSTAKAYKQAAKAEKKSGAFAAAQYNQQAGQARAESQRASIEEHRRARLAESRAVAVAAASGGGASDPTVMKILGNLAMEGEYNALAALYTGEETARGLENQATGALYNAKTAAAGYKSMASASKSSGLAKGVGTLLSGSASFLEKYGDPISTPATEPVYEPYTILAFN